MNSNLRYSNVPLREGRSNKGKFSRLIDYVVFFNILKPKLWLKKKNMIKQWNLNFINALTYITYCKYLVHNNRQKRTKKTSYYIYFIQILNEWCSIWCTELIFGLWLKKPWTYQKSSILVEQIYSFKLYTYYKHY